MEVPHPEVSVIICAYTNERWNALCAAVASVRSQTLPPTEIIIVVDHNADLLDAARQKFPAARVTANLGPRGLSGARNTGILSSSNPWIAFLDDDAAADRDWLKQMTRHCGATDVLGVASRIEPLWSGIRPRWLPDEFLWVVGCSYRGLPKTSTDVRNVMGCAMLIRRSVFQLAGEFNHSLGRSQTGLRLLSCEETELCIRARTRFPGGRFVYEPTAVVKHQIHSERLTWRYFRERCVAEGVSKARLAQLAQSTHALSSERDYVLRTLSRGFVLEMMHGPSGMVRSLAIASGLGYTTYGYLRSRLQIQTQAISEIILQPNR